MKKIMYLLSLAFAMTVVSASLSDVKAQTVKHKTVNSHEKKYALVGAAGGAGVGALVSHKRGKGALIGGAVGAGAGYLAGRHRDKTHPIHKSITKRKH
jgi:uncharacterized protein YcfJ